MPCECAPIPQRADFLCKNSTPVTRRDGALGPRSQRTDARGSEAIDQCAQHCDGPVHSRVRPAAANSERLPHAVDWPEHEDCGVRHVARAKPA